MTAILPYHRVNILTGTQQATVIEDYRECADMIKRAERPLIEYGVELAKTRDIPICATAHTKKKLLELGVEPASSYDIAEIINHLKDPDWRGVKKEGNHDLVMFLGFRTDLGEQGLSTLKHFAPHLKTMTLCKFYYPNASYSLPNLAQDEQWKEFLDNLIINLNSKEA
jgi:acetyl-CoA decarbonylase/synthase complex subunit epsilon